MFAKKTLLPALTLLLLPITSCDSGGEKGPVELPFQGTVAGVVSAEGTVLPGVTVRLTGIQVQVLQTSENGSFSFPSLPAGSYVVAISDYPEHVEFAATSMSAALYEGRGAARADFLGTIKRDASIVGTVTVEGVGLERANISVAGPEGRSATADSEGKFEFDELKRGVYAVTLSGFDPVFYAFPLTEHSADASAGGGVEVHFSGTLVPQPPAAPATLTALATGSSSTDLAWQDASDDETRFEVHRKDSPEATWIMVGAADPDTPAFGDVGLSPNTTYAYRVRACNDVGCSGFTNDAEATTDEVPPEAPSGLAAVAAGPYTVDLSWTDGSNNETRFELERKVGPEGEWTQIVTPASDATSNQDSELHPNTTYTYRIRACNDVGCSEYSSTAEATTDEVLPEAPSDLEAGATGSSTALLTWTDGSDNEAGFEIERKTGSGPAWVPVGTTDPDVPSYSDNGLVPNTTYSYRVRACNSVGCSAYTNEASAVTEEVPPEAPSGLSASADGPNAIDLVWIDGSENEALFRFERKLKPFGAWSEVATPVANTTEIKDTGLSPNTAYAYRVRACNDVGCSPFSSQAYATTDQIPPDAPSGLGASATGSTTVEMSWTDESDNEAQFRVERKEGAGGSWAEIAIRGANGTTFADSGLDPSTTYFYRVRACNAAGCSAFSNEDSATTPEDPPNPPSSLGGSATGTTTIDLSWTDGSNNEDNFRVERKQGAGGAFAEVSTRSQNSTSFSDAGLSPNTTYFYRVSACNGGGCSSPSNEANATTWNVAPAAPSGLSASAVGPSTVDLVWTDNANNETGFRVERSDAGAGSFSSVGSVGVNSTSFTDTGLTANTGYDYRVVAFNGTGDSPPSNVDDATTWPGGGPNLTIENLYLTQSTQTLGGDVPLVTDKDGYLRVFAVASEANSFQPDVRVRFYHGGSLVHTETISAPGSSVPTSVDESSLGSSWNVPVSASLIQPSLTILADVDPTNQVAEGNEGDNSFPMGGSPLAMGVQTIPTFHVTFVPVRQSVNGLVGDVSGSNAADFMDVTMNMLPVAQADVDLHAEYVTNAPALESGNDNGAWGTILNEVRALRSLEGSARYYYGVVEVSYGGGVAGMGYLGMPAAIGWDKLPSGSGVAAHEWGHNWNRYHAPGCGAGSPDPSYPHADGKIGVWGLDIASTSPKSPATHYDFMSYCGPGWISDYSYEAIANYLIAGGGGGAPPQGQAEPSLLIWGRVEGDQIILEPAFEVTTYPNLPAGAGEYLLEAIDARGGSLFSMAFQPTSVPDGLEEEGHFVYTVPLRLLNQSALAGLRVSGGGRTPALRESRRGPEAAAPADPQFTPRPGSEVELTWDAASFPMALVRDPATGQVLSFARGGHIRLPITTDEVEVVFSDGLRSPERTRRTLR